QLLRLDADVLLPRSFFLGVLLDPGFEALARGGVAAGEFDAGYVAVANAYLGIAVLGKEPYHAIGKRLSIAAAIEDVAFDAGAILESQGDVAAIVEGFFEGGADLVIRGQRG